MAGLNLPFYKKEKSNKHSSEIEQFNPDAKDGGLQHDDELDCVSMSQFIIKGRLAQVAKVQLENKTAIERLKDGEVVDKELGIPIAHGIDWSRVGAGEIQDILDMNIQDDTDNSSRV